MRICIHRGTKQIGGSCVEIESKGQRLIIDLGLPLDADSDTLNYLPDIPGLNNQDSTLLGILISHPHLDHFGLLPHVTRDIPVAMGSAARNILEAAAPFLPKTWAAPKPGWDFKSETPVEIGPFVVTPFLVDHSAYDAYSLLIESSGKRLFYSGDFRGHGRKSPLFERFVNIHHDPVDVLLIEGSSLGRLDINDHFPSEKDIETKLLSIFKNTEGIVLVHTSAQNIDRVVSVFRACKRSGRKLVIDLYAAAILEATGNPRLPQSHWPGISLFIPQRQRVQILNNKWFDLLKKHSTHRIFIEDLREASKKSVLLFRPLHQVDLNKANCLTGATYVYSQWEGYWERESFDNLRKWLSQHNIPIYNIHTSGHASPSDLQRLATTLSPKIIVPIHSFNPEKYYDLFTNVEPHNDGEWWEI